MSILFIDLQAKYPRNIFHLLEWIKFLSHFHHHKYQKLTKKTVIKKTCDFVPTPLFLIFVLYRHIQIEFSAKIFPILEADNRFLLIKSFAL
jgi:hypothetical protein